MMLDCESIANIPSTRVFQNFDPSPFFALTFSIQLIEMARECDRAVALAAMLLEA